MDTLTNHTQGTKIVFTVCQQALKVCREKSPAAWFKLTPRRWNVDSSASQPFCTFYPVQSCGYLVLGVVFFSYTYPQQWLSQIVELSHAPIATGFHGGDDSGQGGHLSDPSNCAYGELSIGLSFGEIKCNQRLKKLRTSDSSTPWASHVFAYTCLDWPVTVWQICIGKSMIAVGAV